jgi:hypothetical protein
VAHPNRSLTRAIEHLERGLACKYTAADSVKALNRIYQQLLEGSPGRAPGQRGAHARAAGSGPSLLQICLKQPPMKS